VALDDIAAGIGELEVGSACLVRSALKQTRVLDKKMNVGEK
jgi:hypothetical protein